MSASLGMAAVSLLLASGPLCFTPADQTAGWKRVDVPDSAPALAAPAGVEQFRSGEAGWVLERDPKAYEGTARERAGRTIYRFRLSPDARRLDLQFAEELRGAKVDVVAFAGERQFTLWDGQRIAGALLSIEPGISGAEALAITVHHHLRPVPVVARWTVARWADLSLDLSVPASFRVTRSLYYRHPGGRMVELCDLPGQSLEVDRGRLIGLPASVAVAERRE